MKNIHCFKEEWYYYGIFEVIIEYGFGLFSIELIGGWDPEEEVPEYDFGNTFIENKYCGGLEEAIKICLDDIRNSNEPSGIKEAAEAALARACMEFRLKHHR